MDARPRLNLIDLARSLALVGMAVFHLVYDLTMFGWLPADTVLSGFWALFARLVAGSFIFLAGVSLWLAHGRGIDWPRFWRRFARIVAAAALVTAGTRLAFPDYYVFFGILHSIALSSLIGLAVLRLSSGVVLALAAVVFALPWLWQSPALNGGLAFLGLGTVRPLTVDFLPVFPWAAPMLAGIAFGRLASARGLWSRPALPETPLLQRLAWPGRHSLAIYLIHQPVLISLVWAATWVAG